MKRKLVWIMTLALLAGALICCSPFAQAADTHQDHCVCGGAAVGVADHTTCSTVTDWQPLTGKVNFGTLESGNYYLAEDITAVSQAGVLIGDLILNDGGTETADDDYYTLDRAEHINLCLNGHKITASGSSRVFHGVAQQSTLNICDCSYENGSFRGVITGGTNGSGAILYTYAGSETNIYGGNFTAKEGASNNFGGLIVVAQDRGSVAKSTGVADQFSTLNIYNGQFYGGNSKNGGNINAMHFSHLNIYGGVIRDGVSQKGGNLLIGGNVTLNITGGKIYGGTATTSGGNIDGKYEIPLIGTALYGGKVGEMEESFHVIRDGKVLVGAYTTLEAAMKKAADTPNSYIRLEGDVQEQVTVSGTVYLDLNGHDLSGVSITGKLYAFDTTTDGYDGQNAGTLTPASGTPVIYHQTTKAQMGFAKQYLAVKQDNTYSFHRFTMQITKLTVNIENRGLGYKAAFTGDQVVTDYLDQQGAFGYNLWIDDGPVVSRSFAADQFTKKNEISLMLNNFLDDTQSALENTLRGQEKVHANVFIKLGDGTVVTGETRSYSFRDMLEQVDGRYAQYNTQQQQALKDMNKTFWQAFRGWDIANLHHDETLWTAVDAADFAAKLTKSGSYYNLAAGNYVLTEDVDLGAKCVKIPAGKEVTICLNGHTVQGTNRMFRCYGKLSICDCHADGQEGTLTSSYQNTDTVTAYGAVAYVYHDAEMNLYGGNCISTGETTAGGVIGVSHEGDYSNTNQKPGVLNMFGGTMSGGNVTRYSGLVGMWHESTFNMYGGKLTGGKALETGSAIKVSSGCTFNMYGGEITGNAACETGGAVSAEGIMNMYNDCKITGNQGVNLSVNFQGVLGDIDLTEGAQVGVTLSGQGLVSASARSITGLVSENNQYGLTLSGTRLFMKDPSIAAPKKLDTFSAGYSRVCIDPQEMGLELSGYGNGENRKSTEIGESLYVTAVAVTDENNETVLLIACDLQRPQETITDALRRHISEITGVPVGNIFISASHTHSTPNLYSTAPNIVRYLTVVRNGFVQSAAEAMADRKPCTLETGSFDVEGLNFTRHYQYTDANGVVQYFGDNFGTADYNSTTKHVSEGDPTMHLLAFRRDGQDILLANWRAHPTMTGGATKTVVSADYVGPLRDAVESSTGMQFIYIQGAAGNMNTNSRITSEKHSYNYKQYGQELARQLVEGMDCLESVESGVIQTDSYMYEAQVDHSEDDRYNDAKYVQDHYWAATTDDRKTMLAEYNFTSVYHAYAVVAKKSMGETKAFEISTFSIGKHLGFYTAPGELWASISMEMEEVSPFDMTFTVGYTNGDNKYFLHGEALNYANYEGYYCRFKQEKTVVDMMNYWKKTLSAFFENA